jgi:hypothetical protein
MNEVKNRLSALSMLDRAFRRLPDEQIADLYESLNEESQAAVRLVASVVDEDLEMSALLEAIRVSVAKGRINGDLERMALLLTEQCLVDCIAALGDNSDDPSEENLREVLPAVIEEHTLPVTQVMLASVVTGEATASPMITRLLKHDDEIKLPPPPVVVMAPPPPLKVDDAERLALKEQRKIRKAAEQEQARRRRAQIASSRRK